MRFSDARALELKTYEPRRSRTCQVARPTPLTLVCLFTPGPDSRKFCVGDEPLSVEGGTLTTSLKLRRKAVYERYRDRFESLYS